MHRDMEALSVAGVPVYAVRGAQGGWELDEDWRTRVPGLDDAELSALLMSQPCAIGNPRLAAAAERAIAKLMAAMPDSLRGRANAIRQRLYVDPTGWHGWGENLAFLPIVQDAVSGDRRLKIEYWKAGRDLVERTVDPLGLVVKGVAWYLFAGTPKGTRSYRVSRIVAATLLDERCARPPDFDLAAAWNASAEAFQLSRPRCSAVLAVEVSAVRMMQFWRPGSDAGMTSDGRTKLRVEFGDEGEACFTVLGLGTRAEVLAPASLRRRVANEIAAMASRTALGAAPVAV
ncbi:MAG: WYL domain-containing protein [Acidobacteriota bacterium]|nr:WYL domain-containing protein [Acidobacteriota bacterium]